MPSAMNKRSLSGTARLSGLRNLFAISAVVCGSTSGGNSHFSRGGGHLLGTWRLVSRVVTLEDGTPVQDAGLGRTPSKAI